MLAITSITSCAFPMSAKSYLASNGGHRSTRIVEQKESLNCTCKTGSATIRDRYLARARSGSAKLARWFTSPTFLCPPGSSSRNPIKARIRKPVCRNPRREITMQIRGTSNIQSTNQVNFSNKVQTVQNQSVATQLDTADHVDISSEAQMLSSMNDISDIRAERVAEIREQIATGQYETADKLDSAMDRLLDEIA